MKQIIHLTSWSWDHVGCDTLQRGMVEISGGTWTKTLSWRHRGWVWRAKRWYWLHQVYIIFTSFSLKIPHLISEDWTFDLWNALFLINYKKHPIPPPPMIYTYFIVFPINQAGCPPHVIPKQLLVIPVFPTAKLIRQTGICWNMWSVSRIVDHDIACLQCFQVYASNNLRSGEIWRKTTFMEWIFRQKNNTAWVQWFDKSTLDAYLGGSSPLDFMSGTLWLRTSAERCIMHSQMAASAWSIWDASIRPETWGVRERFRCC